MANNLYPKGKMRMLQGVINFVDDTIKVAMVSSGYTYNTAHEFYTDLGANVLSTDITLASKTVTDGAFDAADVTWTAVSAGSTAKALVIYKDTGSAATSPLLLYADSITGWPLATSGGNITVTWDNGSFKIFSL